MRRRPFPLQPNEQSQACRDGEFLNDDEFHDGDHRLSKWAQVMAMHGNSSETTNRLNKRALSARIVGVITHDNGSFRHRQFTTWVSRENSKRMHPGYLRVPIETARMKLRKRSDV